jgi:hypothetical protein
MPDPGDICLVTWNTAERVRGVLSAVRAGHEPIVLAEDNVLKWLGGFGRVDARRLPTGIDGLKIEVVPYKPLRQASRFDGLRKVRKAMGSPLNATRRLRQWAGQPSATPLICEISFPDGERLLHLNCALHGETDSVWLEQNAPRLVGADWTVVGVDYEQADAMRQRIGSFEPRLVLVTDVVSDARRQMGLPTQLLTPTVDKLITDGLDAHVFVSEASVRFE